VRSAGKKKNHAPGVALRRGEEVVWLGPRLLVIVTKDGKTPSGTRRLRALRLVRASTSDNRKKGDDHARDEVKTAAA
jgi:hypothetical protein